MCSLPSLRGYERQPASVLSHSSQRAIFFESASVIHGAAHCRLPRLPAPSNRSPTSVWVLPCNTGRSRGWLSISSRMRTAME